MNQYSKKSAKGKLEESKEQLFISSFTTQRKKPKLLPYEKGDDATPKQNSIVQLQMSDDNITS